MNNEQIAEKISERMRMVGNIPYLLGCVDRMRQICEERQDEIHDLTYKIEGLIKKQSLLEVDLEEVTNDFLVATQDLDSAFAALYRPIDAPTEVVEKVAKLARDKKAESKVVVDNNKAEIEKHPCHLCEDIFYHKVDLVKHLRVGHGLSMEESVKPAPIRSVCADCLAADCDPFDVCTGAGVTSCDGHQTEPDADQIAWRDSTCREWKECPFTAKCFGLSNEGDPTCFKEDKIRELGEGALAAEKLRDQKLEAARAHRMEIIEKQKAKKSPAGPVVCQNQTCTWADLAQADHCDADEQFRQGRPVAECGCLVSGDSPSKGQDGASCINMECGDYDKSEATGCATWSEVWECPQVVTAGWGPAVEEEAAVVDPAGAWRGQRDAIIKAAIAAGADINEHGVFRNPEVIQIPLPKKGGYQAEIRIATNSDGGFHYGYDLCGSGGSCGPASVTGTVYKTRAAAIVAFVDQLKRAWPEILAGKKLKPVMDAVEDWQDSQLSPVPEPAKKEAKQEVAQPVDELAAQASEIAQPLICSNGECEYFDSSEPDGCFVPADERHGKLIDKCSDFIQVQETIHETASQEAQTEDHQAELANIGAPVSDSAVEPVNYAPLDDALGDCDLCQGYGVIDGELFGDFALVPCNCEAGKKVAGEKWAQTKKSPCEDCNIADPDCASCHLPDMDAPPEADSSLTIDQNRTCCYPSDRELVESNGQQVLYCRECKLIHRVTDTAGVAVEFVLGTKYLPLKEAATTLKCGNTNCTTYDPKQPDNCYACADLQETSGVRRPVAECNDYKPVNLAAATPAPAQITALQQKCTHPKIFRIQTIEGETCKVCKLILLGGVEITNPST